MDETIGVKGGANDQRRRMIISREQKRMLEEYEEERQIAELEKEVKKKQIFTLIKALPIVIGGNVVQTIHDTAVGKKKEDKEEENSRWRIKEYTSDVSATSREEEARKKEERRKKIIVLPTGEKAVVYIHIPEEHHIEDSIPEKEEKKEPSSPVVQQEMKIPPVTEEKRESFTPAKPVGVGVLPPKESTSIPFIPKKKIEDYTEQEIADAEIVDVESFIDRELTATDLSQLSKEDVKKIEQLKSRRIIEEYEKQLKDIRYELRKIIFEYNVLVDKDEEVVLSKDAEIILERLSEVIDKIEELKRKIKIEDLEKYDDNYIYYLIEGYLKEFKDKRVIKEIEDSPLYIMIAEKLDELEEKRGKFSKSVEEKKERLEEKEEDFEKLKDQYLSIDRINNQLLEFQYEQDRVLRDIQEKVRNATTETERVTEEVQGMNQQSRRLLRMLSLQLFLPGPRVAKRFAASAAAYLYFMNNIIRPKTQTKRYRVIVVKDYHDEIKNSMMALEDAIHLLTRTSDQIDKMMRDLEYYYKDYLEYLPDAKELLSNLRKIKSEVEEKEYEMQKIKAQQEKELEKNDAKVKTMGEYPVN